MKHRTLLAEAYRQLDELYAQIPHVECRGLCADSCTVVPTTELEHRRVIDRGFRLPLVADGVEVMRLIAGGQMPRCPALGPLKQLPGLRRQAVHLPGVWGRPAYLAVRTRVRHRER